MHAFNQELGVTMANQQLRQMHREANAAIPIERTSFDPSKIQLRDAADAESHCHVPSLERLRVLPASQ